MVTVRVAHPDELAVCLDVRREVFIEGQQVPEDLEVDGLDAQCTHFVAVLDGQAVGTARLRITPDGDAKAERVAVRSAARGKGIGHLLMDALEDQAVTLGHNEVVLSAQVPVIAFYEHRGYVAEGPVYQDAGIDHRTMRRPCPKP